MFVDGADRSSANAKLRSSMIERGSPSTCAGGWKRCGRPSIKSRADDKVNKNQQYPDIDKLDSIQHVVDEIHDQPRHGVMEKRAVKGTTGQKHAAHDQRAVFGDGQVRARADELPQGFALEHHAKWKRIRCGGTMWKRCTPYGSLKTSKRHLDEISELERDTDAPVDVQGTVDGLERRTKKGYGPRGLEHVHSSVSPEVHTTRWPVSREYKRYVNGPIGVHDGENIKVSHLILRENMHRDHRKRDPKVSQDLRGPDSGGPDTKQKGH